MRLSLSRAASLLAAVAFLAFLATAGAGRYILDELRIGGHAFRQIAAGKDFVADAQPAPLSVAEAYLDVELAAAGRLDAAENFAPVSPICARASSSAAPSGRNLAIFPQS